MQQTGFNSSEITQDERQKLSCVSSLTVSNYGANDVFVTIANVKRTIPAFDPALKVPYFFNIPGDGTLSDIEILIEFDITKTGRAILDYRKSTPNQ